MSNGLLLLDLLAYSAVLWLGLYLVGRNPANPRLRWAGLGLATYALGLGLGLLMEHAPTPALASALARLHWPMLAVPAIFGCGAMVNLLPEAAPGRPYLDRKVSYLTLPAAVAFYLLGAGTQVIFDFSAAPPRATPVYLLLAGSVLLILLAAGGLAVRALRAGPFSRSRALTGLAALLFALSASPLSVPLNVWPRHGLLLAVSADFVGLGLVLALLDAFEEDEALLYDLVHSLDFTVLGVAVFGGPVALMMGLSTGVTWPMLALLLAMITLAVLTQTFGAQAQQLFDALALRAFPRLRQERTNLRAMADALPRINEAINPAELDEGEFARLTRHAISHLGNLPRLATSPLTRLPVIDARLARRQASPNTLERAAELKGLLTESIVRLKPRDKGDFGSTEEWRHYNALYFPYVAGLKPYTRRAEQDSLPPAAQEALAWFHAQVPERTLHNWQTAAAKLVAKDLREGLNGH